MKNFFRGIVFAIIALALGGWLYLRFGFADMCANVAVSRFDSVIASTALHASAARHTPKEKNPIQPTDANLFDGARLYRDKCADCHGRPDNPESDYGESFYPQAPQFMKVHPICPTARTFTSSDAACAERRCRHGARSWRTAKSGRWSRFSATWITSRPQLARSFTGQL